MAIQSPSQSLAQAPMPRQDRERKQAMHEAWKAYRGKFQPPLKIDKDQPDDNVLSNRCAPIVDKGVSFLFGQILKIEATTRLPMASNKIQDFLDGLWGDDDTKMTLLGQLALNGGVCGQAFIKLIPAQGLMKYPRIVILDPQLIRIVTSPDDCSLVLAYIIEYPGLNDFENRQIIARVDPNGQAGIIGEYDIQDTWTITNYMRKAQLSPWIQVGGIVGWPYPFPPIFSCQNLPNPNEAWGTSDLTPDLIEMNKVLNFIQSNTSRIIKYHGHPLTVAIGMHASQIEVAIDETICLPAPDSKIEKLAPMDNFSGLIGFAAVIRSDMDEQSRVPAVALGRMTDLPKGTISGVALQLLFQPLIEKTVQKQRLYGSLIREVSRAAIVLAGLISIEDFQDYQIGLHWKNLLPIDDLAAAQTSLLWKQLGVSSSTLMQTAGFDPDDEADKSAMETVRKAAQMSPPPVQQDQQEESPFIGG